MIGEKLVTLRQSSYRELVGDSLIAKSHMEAAKVAFNDVADVLEKWLESSGRCEP